MTSDHQPDASYQMQWELDFSKLAGQAPDPAVWNFDLGDGSAAGIPGWGNQEREYYIAEAVKVNTDGLLEFSAQRQPEDNPYPVYYGGSAEWTSGKITTAGKVHFHYGRIEAELLLAEGVGTWPAFWMLGTNLGQAGWPQCGEIDIMEHRGDMPKRLFATIHGPGYSGDQGRGAVRDFDHVLGGKTHLFSVDWLPGSIEWKIDGETYLKLTQADLEPNQWVFDHPFYLILNLAMGGNFCGPIDPELNQASYQVSAIRHYSIDGVGQVIRP